MHILCFNLSMCLHLSIESCFKSRLKAMNLRAWSYFLHKINLCCIMLNYHCILLVKLKEWWVRITHFFGKLWVLIDGKSWKNNGQHLVSFVERKSSTSMVKILKYELSNILFVIRLYSCCPLILSVKELYSSFEARGD